ncbi:hypothetical protein MT391_20055 [Vibrio sp. 1-Bac 57]
MKLSLKEIEQRIISYCESFNVEYIGCIETDYKKYSSATNPSGSVKFMFTCANDKHEPYKKVIQKFNQGCVSCSGERVAKFHRLSEAELTNFLAELNLKLVSPYKDYRNQNSIITVSKYDSSLKWDSSYASLKSGRTILGCKSIIEFAIKQILQVVFPSHKFITIRPGYMNYPETKANLEIDCFCESLNNCGIEIDGIQHDQFTKGIHKTENDFVEQQKRDDYSDKAFYKQHSINLVRLKESKFHFNVFESLKYPHNAELQRNFISRVYNALVEELPATVSAEMVAFDIAAEELKDLSTNLNLISPIANNAKALCADKGWIFVKIVPVGNYVKDNYLVEFICDRKHTDKKTIANLKNHGCHLCQIEDHAIRRRFNPKEVRDEYELVGCVLAPDEEKKYKNNSSYLWFTYKVCGHREENSLGHLQFGRKCKVCNKLKKFIDKANEFVEDYASFGRTVSVDVVMDFKKSKPDRKSWNGLNIPHIIDACGHECHERLSKLKGDPKWRKCRHCIAEEKVKASLR